MKEKSNNSSTGSVHVVYKTADKHSLIQLPLHLIQLNYIKEIPN